MKITVYFTVFLLAVCSCLAAGNYSGSISFQNSGAPAEGATVRLLDTAKVQQYHTITDKKGKFEFRDVRNGKYTLHITYVGYKTIDFGYTITDKSKKDLGSFNLEISEKQTDNVTVEAEAILGEMVADTAQYNADAVKVDSNAKVAELLKKIPGLDVQADGTVKSGGKAVEKILVDGRTFFSDDTKAVLENIPAKSVDKVQVYDKASDKDEFVGNDVDKDKKAINITLKKDSKRSAFGNVNLGGGTRNRYECNMFTNMMDGSLRASVLGWINNTNHDGIDFGNLFSSGNYSMANNIFEDYDGNDWSNWNQGGISGTGAISKTSAVGVNVSDDFWIFKKTNIMYFFKKRRDEANSETKRDYFPITETSQMTDKNSNSSNDKYYHTFTAKADEVQLSKRNGLQFNFKGETSSPKYGYSSNTSTNYHNGSKISNADTRENNNSDVKNLSNYLGYRYKFDKPDRTFSMVWNLNYHDEDAKNDQNSFLNYYVSNKYDTLRQHRDTYNRNTFNSFSISGSEPFAKYSQVAASYTLGINNTHNNVSTYDVTGGSVFDSSLSSRFRNEKNTQTATLRYKFKKDKLTVSPEIGYETTHLDGTAVLPYNYKVDYTTSKFLPSVWINFKPQDANSMNNSIDFQWYTSNTTPEVYQLQEVADNSDPLWISKGNSHLEAAYENHLNYWMFLSSGPRKNMWMQISTTFIDKPISNNIFTAVRDTVVEGIPLAAGQHLTRLLNLGKSQKIDSQIGVNFPSKLLKGSAWSICENFQYEKQPTMIDDKRYNSLNRTLYTFLSWYTTYSDKFEFSISNIFAYNFDKNSASGYSISNNYTKYMLDLGVKWTYWKTAYFRIKSSNVFYSGSFYNKGDYNYNLLDGVLGADFFHGRKINVELTFTDMLHDRKSINNLTGLDYKEFRTRSVLKNYILLSVKYKFNTMGLPKKDHPENDDENYDENDE